VLHQGPGALSSANRAIIDDLGAVNAKVVGGSLPPTVDTALAAAGLEVERIGAAAEPDVLSGEVAQWIAQRYAVPNVIAVAESAPTWALALAAAFAASQGTALVQGAHAVQAVERPVWAVGPNASALGGLTTGSRTISGTTAQGLAAALAAAAPNPLQQFTMAPESNGTLLELAALGLPIVLHDAGGRGGTEAVLARRDEEAPGRVYLAGIAGGLGAPAYRRLQSDLNGFGVHLLTGVAGQGLPVISQPLAERPVGLARPGDSPPPPLPPPPSWLGWGS
jgi:hypothetical protein